jgi:hypothetical protein
LIEVFKERYRKEVLICLISKLHAKNLRPISDVQFHGRMIEGLMPHCDAL